MFAYWFRPLETFCHIFGIIFSIAFCLAFILSIVKIVRFVKSEKAKKEPESKTALNILANCPKCGTSCENIAKDNPICGQCGRRVV